MAVQLIKLKGREFHPDTRIILEGPSPAGVPLSRVFRRPEYSLSERLTGFVPLAELPTDGFPLTTDHDPHNSLSCSNSLLVDHILLVHTAPHILICEKIPRFDLELMQHRGFDGTELANNIYSLLEGNILEVWTKIYKKFGKSELEVIQDLNKDGLNWRELSNSDIYRIFLVKTLIYMEKLKLSSVDWARVKIAFPAAETVKLNLKDDSNEQFYFVAAIEG